MQTPTIRFECPSCGADMEAAAEKAGWVTVCADCRQSFSIPQPVDLDQTWKIRVVTSPDFLRGDARVSETLDSVHAMRVVAMGPVADIKTFLRDAVGGRAKTVEAAFAKARSEVLNDLRAQALRKRAHAIVSLNVEIGELNQSIVFVAASGTPVILSSQSS